MQKEVLKGMPIGELQQMMEALGHSSYRGRQLFHWINQKRETDFEKMTNFSKLFRKELAQTYDLPSIRVSREEHSDDGTVKYLVELADGNHVESVFIPFEDRNTLCISTQVGCKMGCTFCATGYMKFTRNLKSWEMVDQLLALTFPVPITNIVFMGMGEPFDNYDEVVKALRIFQDPMGPQIGKRHITVSTVGVTSRLQEFIDLNLAKLAISLHGTLDEQRSSIMPINRKYPLSELMETCRHLKFPGTQRVTFEYVLLKDVNDTDEDAHRLVKLVQGFPCKINLLAYNENPFIPLKRPTEDRVLSFQRILLVAGLTATYRRSRGRDIAGACGQLHTEMTVKKTAVAGTASSPATTA